MRYRVNQAQQPFHRLKLSILRQNLNSCVSRQGSGLTDHPRLKAMHWIPTTELAISQPVACLICCSLLTRLVCRRRRVTAVGLSSDGGLCFSVFRIYWAKGNHRSNHIRIPHLLISSQSSGSTWPAGKDVSFKGESVYRILGHRLAKLILTCSAAHPLLVLPILSHDPLFDIIAYISAEPSESLIPRQGLVSRSMPNRRSSNSTMVQGSVD
ncbi:hypothetical protein C8J56DRAFT_593007 [Mycena floridula]|nr:hypothetical protein C8J56DRAFT_593007 [Mycena floridula]